MTEDAALTVQDVVARNVRRFRRSWRRRWSQAEFAARLAELSADDKWDASMVSKVENQRRRITLDELVSMAIVLGVSPVELLMPSEGERVRVGFSEIPREIYLQGVVMYPVLWAKLHQSVMSKDFGGEATIERLIEAGFKKKEAELIASEDFQRWEVPWLGWPEKGETE